MTSIKLIESMIQDLLSIEKYDYTGVTNFKERVEMLLGKIYGQDPRYNTKLKRIRFGPIYSGMMTAQDRAMIKEETWISAVRKTGNLFDVMLDEIKLSDVSEDAVVHREKKRIRSNRIFIVHGHDDEMKLEVARTIEKLGLEPVILHEQPNMGRTIIEKVIDHSNVGFAVVLLSPDDLGCSAIDYPDGIKHRARQNVIMELGFFLGKLGRNSVLPLYRSVQGKDLELPSEYDGVIYTKFSEDGGWKLKLVQELNAISYNVDANRL